MADKALIAQLKQEMTRIESNDSGHSEYKCDFEEESRTRDIPVKRSPVLSDDELDAAFKKILMLVNIRDRSVKQIEERLRKEGYPDGTIKEAVDRAISCKILDDLRFAEALIRSRINQGKGSAGIERELKGEGIDIDTVPGWPYEFDVSYDQEYDRALNLLMRKPTRAKNKRHAAYRKLVQAGFSSRVASDASRFWCDQNEYC